MKTTLIATLLFLVLIPSGFAQHVPQGMKYQAVARDMKGRVIANQDLQLRISLYADPLKKAIDYVEIHKVITNELGLFSLTVGEGFVSQGIFSTIPWSTGEVWMEVAIQTDDETDFVTISDSRMLSVPYAFHALTASEITGPGISTRGGDNTTDPPVEWRITGNKATDPTIHKLGTTDRVDLVIVTTSLERIRILSSGQVLIRTDLVAEQNVNLNAIGGQTINNGNLTVRGKTLLLDNLAVEGSAYMNRNLEVDSIARFVDTTESFNPSTGALTVNGGVGIGGNLNVAGDVSFGGVATFGGKLHIKDQTQSTSTSTGALIVDGGVGIAKRLNVGEAVMLGSILEVTGNTVLKSTTQSTNKDDGSLIVEGGVGVEKNLNIGGTLGVRGSNSGYMANIENTDASAGDGLEIKLGKNHPAWNGGGYINIPDPGAEFFDGSIATVRGWIEGDPFEFTDVLNFIPSAWIAGTACNLVETLAEELNDALGLPVGVPPLTDAVIFDAINSFADDLILDDWRPDDPTTIIPGFNLPVFPTDFCPDFLPSFSMPNISFVNVNNSLTTANQFLSFKDKEGRELGSVRALSVTEWGNTYFDGVYLVNFLSNTISLDPLDIALSCVREFTVLADDYNHIGVEYASGHGDYAEWLERVDPAESISRGDIVAVIGGKITKNISGAEQVMAVSEHPIVLGNLPTESESHKGNNVAFMGQIPVKIVGPVTTGDYILANGKIPGYGIAKSQKELKVEDMPLVVGRSWETKPGEGPKMVNTVVGVHNGDYFRILKQYEQKLNDAEARIDNLSRESAGRMESLENRLDMLMERLDIPENKVTYKK